MCGTEMGLSCASSSFEESQLQNPLQRAQNPTDRGACSALSGYPISFCVWKSSSHHPRLLNPPESLTNFYSAKVSYCLIGQHEQPLLEIVGFYSSWLLLGSPGSPPRLPLPLHSCSSQCDWHGWEGICCMRSHNCPAQIWSVWRKCK